MSRQSSSKSWMQRSLEKQSCRSTSREELQRFWRRQRRVDGIRVEYFPRIQYVATTSKKKKRSLLETFHKYAFKLFWNVDTWHELEDMIFYGQWIKLHDRSQNTPKSVTNDYLVWSLTFTILVNTNNIVMWETLPNNADWDCFKTPILQEIYKTQNPLREERSVFGSHTFVPRSWMCKKQTSVSHSSTEAETISLAADIRMDGIPGLDLWDSALEVFHSSPIQLNNTKRSSTRKLVAWYHIKQAHPQQNQGSNPARHF